MLVLRSLVIGFGKTLAAPLVVLAVWLANLLVALPAAVAVTASLQRSFGRSLSHERMRAGFDMVWFDEYRHAAKGIETTFKPTLAGAGAFLENLESWIDGPLLYTFPGIAAAGVLYALLWALLVGGVLERFAHPDERPGGGRFARAGVTYFFRFFRLAVLSCGLYLLVYLVSVRLYRWLEGFTRDMTSETAVLGYSLAALGLIALLLGLIHIAFDYAKIVTVVEDRRSMLFAALSGIGFVLANPIRTLALYGSTVLAGVGLLWLYARLAPVAGPSTAMGVALAFLLGQAMLLGKLALRMTLLGGEMELYLSLANR